MTKRDMAGNGGRGVTGRARALALAGAAGCLCLTAAAAEPGLGGPDPRLPVAPRTVDRGPDARDLMRPQPAPGRTDGFYRGAFLPRLATRLERHRDVTNPLVAPGQEWLEELGWQRVSDDVQRDVERATQKALRDHLLENTNLRDVVARLDRRSRGGLGGAQEAGPDTGTGATPVRRNRGIDFDLGFRSALPVVKMEYALDGGDLRLHVGVSGDVDLRYRHAALGSTEVSAEFDGDDHSYRFFASFGF